MNIAEQKLELIRKIISTTDLQTLIQIEELLKNETSHITVVNEPSSVYQKIEEVRVFDELQQAKIDKATRQYENGECISDEEAQKEIQAWLED